MEKRIDIRGFYKTLDRLYEKKEMENIEPYMLKTLLKAGELRDLEGVISVCNELGGWYRAMRRTEEALWTYEKVIDGLEQLGMKETENYIAALINLGNVYISRKAYDRAYELEQQALELLERVGGHVYQRAALYNNMSASLRELGRLEEAENMALQAIQIVGNIPECVAEVATSYTNLGQAQAKRQAYSDARRSFTHALRLFENHSDDRDIHYAAAVYALAGVEEAEGCYEEAKRRYIRAAGLVERDFGHNRDYEQIMADLQRLRGTVQR